MTRVYCTDFPVHFYTLQRVLKNNLAHRGDKHSEKHCNTFVQSSNRSLQSQAGKM